MILMLRIKGFCPILELPNSRTKMLCTRQHTKRKFPIFIEMSRGYIIYIIFIALTWSSCEEEQLVQQTPIPVKSNVSNNLVLMKDEVNGLPIVIVGHSMLMDHVEQESHGGSVDNNVQWEFVVAFERTLNDEPVDLSPVYSGFPVVMKDESGNQFDFMGNVVSGPDIGNSLTPVNSGIGYWFAFASAFPGIGINGHMEPDPFLAIDPSSILPGDAHICTGAGIDGIRALDDPEHVETGFGQSNLPEDEDLILGVLVSGEARAYPHDILNYHEVVNDIVGDQPITISYCPLTGTGKVWHRKYNDHYFGVSGQLYQSNLLMFDRASGSRWWQIGGEAILGLRKGEKISQGVLIETTWRKWRELTSNTTLLSYETGYPHQYDFNPYGDYQEEHSKILVPISRFSEDIIQAKDRVFGVIVDNVAKVYLAHQFL